MFVCLREHTVDNGREGVDLRRRRYRLRRGGCLIASRRGEGYRRHGGAGDTRKPPDVGRPAAAGVGDLGLRLSPRHGTVNA